VLQGNTLVQLDLWIALHVKRGNPKNLVECPNVIFVLLENMLLQLDWRNATSVLLENMLPQLDWRNATSVLLENMLPQLDWRNATCVLLVNTLLQLDLWIALIVARTSCRKKAHRVAIHVWICTNQDPDLGRVYSATLDLSGIRKRLHVCNAKQTRTKSSQGLQGAQGVWVPAFSKIQSLCVLR
jgi:hypothetical protein